MVAKRHPHPLGRPVRIVPYGLIVLNLACSVSSPPSEDLEDDTPDQVQAEVEPGIDANQADTDVAADSVEADSLGDGADTGQIPEDDTQPSGTCKSDADCSKLDGPCTLGTCGPTGTCGTKNAPPSSACSDGNPCTLGDSCQEGTCSPGPVKDCGDDNPCTEDSCVASTGSCANLPGTGASCDDGSPCSAEDSCVEGKCQGTVNICPCLATTDCLPLNDENLCNGSLYCDKSVFPYACKMNPATIVVCPTAQDTDCAKNTCDSKTGLCAPATVKDGATCDDGDSCTTGDICESGKCVSGADTCKCQIDGDCAKLEDGDACNGTLFCNKQNGQCELNSATIVKCPTVDDTFCRVNLCVPQNGTCVLTAQNEKVKCDDGDPCTTGDTCIGGTCTSTANTCICTKNADCASQEDGNLCNGTLYCNVATGKCEENPATKIVCPSAQDTTCLKNTCQPATGICALSAAATGISCDADGLDCTVGDSCNGKGACVSGTNTCACLTDADCASKEDGDLCNGQLYCVKSAGKSSCELNPATIIKCPSAADTACQSNTCEPKSGTCGMVAINFNGACDDGDPCTLGDVCDGKGACLAGKDVCACKVDSECSSKDDGNVCNGTFFCDKTKVPFQCAPLASSVPPEGSTCDDGDPCTKAEVCKSGLCVGTNIGPSACDDGNSCTADQCLSATGKCANLPLSVGICDDGDLCTDKSGCAQGACTALTQKLCDDGDPCTTDSCKAAIGCLASAMELGAPCGPKKTCVGDKSSPVCSCATGYSANNLGDCIDIDECKQAGVCSAGSHCVNTLGSYACECDKGFELKNQVCVDVDECAASPGPCPVSAGCKNLLGSYQCTCAAGSSYKEGLGCVAIDECAETTWSGFGNVVWDTGMLMEDDSSYAQVFPTHSLMGTSYVELLPEASGAPGKVVCNEWVDPQQPPPSRWQPSPDGYRVVDKSGKISWKQAANSQPAAPWSVCQSLRFPAVWPVDTVTKFTFRLASDLPTGGQLYGNLEPMAVIQVFEPADVVMGIPQLLAKPVVVSLADLAVSGDTGQAFEVAVENASKPGISLSISVWWAGDQEADPAVTKGFRVFDVVVHGGKRCAPNATCVDKPGGALPACSCGKGFGGNGNSCPDIDECISGAGPCQTLDPYAECTNKPGSYVCDCPPYADLQGGKCVDTNHCAKDNGGCGPAAKCIDLPYVTGPLCDCTASGHVWVPDGGGTCIADQAIWPTTGGAIVVTNQSDGTLLDEAAKIEWSGVPQSVTPKPISQLGTPNLFSLWLSAQKFCDDLEIGDKKDWRLPTLSELLRSYSFPTSKWVLPGNYAPHVVSATWFANPANQQSLGPATLYSDGSFGQGVFGSWYLTCVRGTPTLPQGARFDDSKAGIVADTWLEHEWQVGWSATALSFADAASYCQNLALDGGGWRVPTVSEYLSVLSYANVSAWLPPGWSSLAGSATTTLWTSTTSLPSNGSLYGIHARQEFSAYKYGLQKLSPSQNPKLPVRCIRDFKK